MYYNETSKAIGGSNYRGGKQFISRPRGRNANEFAIHEDPPKFSLMVCAATSTDTTCAIDRPCLVWEKDTDDLRLVLEGKIEASNTKAKEKAQNKTDHAKVPGTAEERAFRELNNNI